MSVQSFDEASLIDALGSLALRGRITFGALICRRNAAWFEYFNVEDATRVAKFDSILASLWSFISEDAPAPSEEQGLEALSLMPMEEDMGRPFAPQSEDAVACLAYALEIFGGSGAESASLVARRSYESADNLAQKQFDPVFPGEGVLLSSELVQMELMEQLQDLELASAFNDAPLPASEWQRAKDRGQSYRLYATARVSSVSDMSG